MLPCSRWMVAMISYQNLVAAQRWDLLRSFWQWSYINSTGWIAADGDLVDRVTAWYKRTDFACEDLVTYFDSWTHMLVLLVMPDLRTHVRRQLILRNRQRTLQADRYFRGALGLLAASPSAPVRS